MGFAEGEGIRLEAAARPPHAAAAVGGTSLPAAAAYGGRAAPSYTAVCEAFRAAGIGDSASAIGWIRRERR